MTAGDAAVFVTIAAAVACWAAGEVFRSRTAWTAGALLALLHSAAAFVLFYDSSHAVAQAMTRQQTMALTGLDVSSGIYVNYAFLAIWTGDVIWWWISPRTHDARPRLVDSVIRGFLCFIVVNGAVVFADGLARIVGMLAVAAVVVQWSRQGAMRAGRHAPGS